ncbi:class F sortase [Nocardioides sp. T5]|uniref:class F sortase n=1 Tax=Nocardioides sp. T5 TaxID=3400182 RepID=UPI003A88FDCC
MRTARLVSAARWTTVIGGAVALTMVAAMVSSTRSDDIPDSTAVDTATSLVTEQAGVVPVPTVEPETPAPLPPGPPLALRIPALGLYAPVVTVGLDARGALVPPADPRVVGWWEAGARPGSARGTAVLAGHTVHDGGGVFDDLAGLQPGDTIEVFTDRRALDFTVRSVRDLGRAELAARAGRLFATAGAPGLVLVTCTDWDGERYRGNTVVVARVR